MFPKFNNNKRIKCFSCYEWDKNKEQCNRDPRLGCLYPADPFFSDKDLVKSEAIKLEQEIEERKKEMFGDDKDSVNHPSHYTTGKIEVIDFIEDKKLNYHKGNAVKYIIRAGKKNPNKEIEDLHKAVWYINREIKRLQQEVNN